MGGRRGGISGARPSALKALLQRSSLHELLAVLQASHQFVVRASCMNQPSRCSGAEGGSHTADSRHVCMLLSSFNWLRKPACSSNMLLRLTCLHPRCAQEVRDPRDTQVPQQLAKAYRLHARARVPSPADLASNVRTLLHTGAAQPVFPVAAAARRFDQCLQPAAMLSPFR